LLVAQRRQEQAVVRPDVVLDAASLVIPEEIVRDRDDIVAVGQELPDTDRLADESERVDPGRPTVAPSRATAATASGARSEPVSETWSMSTRTAVRGALYTAGRTQVIHTRT
jgi:hypothetical protein